MQDYTQKTLNQSNNWCPTCGNTGWTLEGNPCPECKARALFKAASTKINWIPERYQGISLVETLIKPITDYYASDLISIQNTILSNKKLIKNQYLASPINSSKSILVYSTLQLLYAGGVEIFPYFDIEEIRRIMSDRDDSKEPIFLRNYNIDPLLLYEVPVLFIKVPANPSTLCFESLQQILDRRVRRGNGTIIISNLPWKVFCIKDKYNYVTYMSGDGDFNSLKVYDYFYMKDKTTK